MTHPPQVDGALLLPLYEALRIPWRDVRDTWLSAPDSLEVTYLLRDERGAFYRDGDDAASVTVRVRVEWPSQEKSS